MGPRRLILLLFVVAGCIQRSNDALIDMDDRWVDDDYILGQSGDSEALALLKARRQILKGEFRQAWQVLYDPALRYVVNPEFSFIKGKIQYAFGDYVQAARYLEDAEQLGFTGYEMYVLLARVNLALDRQEKALGITELLISQRPDAMNTNLRAQVLEATGDSTEAQKQYIRSLRQDSGILENYLGLGRLYREKENFDAALVLMDRGSRRFPDDRDLLQLNATIHQAASDYRGAIALTSVLLESQPSDPALLAWRADLYLANRQYDSAVYSATESLLYREDAATRLLLAGALERQRLYGDALEAYQRVYDADSTNTRAAEGVRRLEGRRRYLDYLRKQRQDSIQQQIRPDSSANTSR